MIFIATLKYNCKVPRLVNTAVADLLPRLYSTADWETYNKI